MSLLVAFSVAPASPDPDGSYAEAVAAAVRVVRESGLPHETNAMFTNVEGDWDEVMAVVKAATMAVAAVSSRVSLVLKADLRDGVTDAMTSKVASVEDHLSGS
ncbi:MAG: S-adenosyl-L-methionine-dependent methyl transferase [Frankiales bacterium]|nr:S-adenosyl-L-methionine-dependent methyl transferase [Frankiales bacterium]